MAVETTTNRQDTVVLIGPLDELYNAAAPIIRSYLQRNWTFSQSQTDPNAGPRMQLFFQIERVSP